MRLSLVQGFVELHLTSLLFSRHATLLEKTLCIQKLAIKHVLINVYTLGGGKSSKWLQWSIICYIYSTTLKKNASPIF